MTKYHEIKTTFSQSWENQENQENWTRLLDTLNWNDLYIKHRYVSLNDRDLIIAWEPNHVRYFIHNKTKLKLPVKTKN